MEEISCDTCKKRFWRKRSQIGYAGRHYCSKRCHYVARRLGMYTKCASCHKLIYKTLRAVKNSQNKKFFCSKRCSNIILGQINSRSNHPNWKGGEYSYREFMNKQAIDKVCLSCGIDNKQVLVVHHLDRNRRNNDIKNLVWLCQNCHFLSHHYKDEKNKILKYAES